MIKDNELPHLNMNFRGHLGAKQAKTWILLNPRGHTRSLEVKSHGKCPNYSFPK